MGLGHPFSRWLTEPGFWSAHLHPEDRQWVAEFSVAATRRLEPHAFEFRMLAADGRVVWLKNLVPVVAESDCPVKLRGILVDITQHKTTEAALRQSEERFRQLAEHILFVDDEEPLARLGRTILQRLGYRVTAHTRPAEALAAFRAQPAAFDLVITDFNMPGLDGIALRPGLRVILMTGYSASMTEDVTRELGFRALLPKPYELRSLGEAVQRALR